MDFSVILCTYNRAANLPACIDHLNAQQGIDDIDWEVVVVDNNSTDDTADTVARLIEQSPLHMRYLFEPTQGLSSARNCGIRGSMGRHVIFIDDDIHAAPGWLRAYADAFAAHDCDAVGGRILVASPLPLPKWIQPEMMGFLGQFDHGDQPLPLDGRRQHPFGGNMAFHRRAIERVGDFDPELGRKGEGKSPDELFKGEETEYFRLFSETGGKVWYAPGAVVTHHILPYQLKRRFFLTIHYNEGVQSVAFEKPYRGPTLLGAPRFVYPQALRALLRYLGETLVKGPNGSMRQMMTAAYFFGRLRAFMQTRPTAARA